MSRVNDLTIWQDERAQELNKERRLIMQGKSDKLLTKEHQEAVEYEHRKLVEGLQ